MDPRTYRAEESMLDFTPYTIRAIRPDDKRRLDAHFHSLSQHSVQQRFFQSKSDLTAADLVQLTELDFVHHLALVATLGQEPGERIVGVGRAIESPARDGARTAEVAFAVADAFQGRGIGRALLAHLAVVAREVGFEKFEAYTLSENARMLDVFLLSGFEVRQRMESGTIHVEFPILERATRPG